MPTSTRQLIRSTSVFLLVGFVALMAIVGTNFWLGERAQAYFADAMAARDTRVAAVELAMRSTPATLPRDGPDSHAGAAQRSGRERLRPCRER